MARHTTTRREIDKLKELVGANSVLRKDCPACQRYDAIAVRLGLLFQPAGMEPLCSGHEPATAASLQEALDRLRARIRGERNA